MSVETKEKRERVCGHVHAATREDALRPGDQGRRRQPRDASPVAPRTRSVKGVTGVDKTLQSEKHLNEFHGCS